MRIKTGFYFTHAKNLKPPQRKKKRENKLD
jgi:hypothetical protein